MINKALSSALVVVGICAATMAQATPASTSWDFGGSGSPSAYKTFTSAGHTVKATAFYTANNNGAGKLSSAEISQYSGGLGVKSPISATDPGCSSGSEGTSPNHAADNCGRDEIILLEFDTFFNPETFSLGWIGADSDIQVWIGAEEGAAGIGDNPGLNLTNFCVIAGAGCTGTFADLGFTALPVKANVPIDVAQSISSTGKVTRYVAISGNLAALNPDITSGNDYFKLKTISGTKGMNVPVPGSLALLALGLMCIAFGSRRSGANRLV